ncbi:MAG: CapA family protein [Chloroflexota bacterium]|nr:CapA family protein [Chloroflexota bacterium]
MLPTARPLLALGLALVVAGCSLAPTPTPTPPTPTAVPTASPSPTPVPPTAFPLAVVTGFTNLKAATTMAELEQMASAGTLVIPCGLQAAIGVRVSADSSCTVATEIAAALRADSTRVALLPPGLVEPATKVLPVDGADLFGGPAARAAEYPAVGLTTVLPPGWTTYEPAEIRTLISLGDSCPDRGVAYQAITLGKGWDWVFGGGRARYLRVYPNPVPLDQVGGGYNIVDAEASGDPGAVARLVSSADITLDDFECPVVDDWRVNGGVVFSIDPAVLPQLRDTYGVDVVTLAANHLFDRGTRGFLETLEQFAGAGIPRAGAGRDLDDALAAAVVDVNGLRFAFVGFNEVPGSQAAATGVPGVAWLTDDNVRTAVTRARAQADLVFCVPQWWGGAEYHGDFTASQLAQQATFYAAGCDHVIGHGTHWSGPIDFVRTPDGAVHFTIASHGNFLFGQQWSQQTQEGLVLELAFRGTTLAQVRMHPYIMLLQAQTNLIDPETDGAYVLNRVFNNSDVGY